MKISIIVLTLVVLGTGCFSSRPSNRYILENNDPSVKVDISLRRLEMAGYLEHSEIMRRVGECKIESMPGEMWAGSFRRMLENALRDGMTPKGKRVVSLKVRRFEVADDNQFHVEVDCFENGVCRRIAFELPCDFNNAGNVLAAYRAAVLELLKKL